MNARGRDRPTRASSVANTLISRGFCTSIVILPDPAQHGEEDDQIAPRKLNAPIHRDEEDEAPTLNSVPTSSLSLIT
ncbi:unnamed protein product [Cochlearia groenlandica]